MENVVNLDQNRQGCPYKAGVNRLKSIQAANCYSEKSFVKNLPQQQQLAASNHQHTQPLVKFLDITSLQ